MVQKNGSELCTYSVHVHEITCADHRRGAEGGFSGVIQVFLVRRRVWHLVRGHWWALCRFSWVDEEEEKKKKSMVSQKLSSDGARDISMSYKDQDGKLDAARDRWANGAKNNH